MPQYTSPGVYVEEVPSAVKPIAGVGTSTAAFIGIVPDRFSIPEPDFRYDPTQTKTDPAPLFAAGGGAGVIGARAVGVGGAGAAGAAAGGAGGGAGGAGGGAGAAGAAAGGAGGGAGAAGAAAGGAAQTNSPYQWRGQPLTLAPPNEPKLCTSFSNFIDFFGDFSTDLGQRNLAHAVYGFFHNGGSRCWVARMVDDGQIDAVLKKFESIDEIAIVLAPGLINLSIRSKIDIHCRQTMKDRFAILDSPLEVDPIDATMLPPKSDYAAYYFPWIQVFDPATKIQDPKGDGLIYVPPSGHVAGIYARVDTERGVHKAPANEVVLGALGLKYKVSKPLQDNLNPAGVNCIRDINGNIRVWGARTIGGDANQDWKYVNVRRLFLFLRESIDEGTQWVVFEPNDRALWAKIIRNVSAFLMTVWRDGALFGDTPKEAFYVKCDDETNPREKRDLGMVVTEIGVAVVKPAEFVIFRISQWPGPPEKSQ